MNLVLISLLFFWSEDSVYFISVLWRAVKEEKLSRQQDWVFCFHDHCLCLRNCHA